MKVLVCGGRDFTDQDIVFSALDAYHEQQPVTEIIQGAAKGADYLAFKWAKERLVPCRAFPANWGKYGKAAGPLRNLAMLTEGKPDMVLAFPGGVGTDNMVAQAKQHGIPVRKIEVATTTLSERYTAS